jgi:hypothetical protein
MKRIVFALAWIGVLAGAVATTPVSGQSEGEAAPIYGIKIPQSPSGIIVFADKAF